MNLVSMSCNDLTTPETTDSGADSGAAPDVELSHIKEMFEDAWEEKVKEGYQYGQDALDQVQFGFEIAYEYFNKRFSREMNGADSGVEDVEQFWAAIRKSAELVRGVPVWTQAGLVVSDNFNGPHVAKSKVA